MSVIQFAGEYNLEECTLCTVGGLELDLIDLVVQIHIHEDIFNNAIAGSISFIDTNKLLGNSKVGIVGQEKLRLKISTPTQDDTDDRNIIINFTDSPLRVFKIANKVEINEGSEGFMLEFVTPEVVRNNHIRVTKSYVGEPSEEIVQSILRDEELINSKKEFYYEKTANNFKLVAPNQRPFTFINNLAKRCLSNDYDFSPTFLFYETCRGYFFRTLDSMMDRKNPKGIWRQITPTEIEMRDNIAAKMQSIESVEVLSTMDTLVNRRSGMYSSRLMLLDIFNKDYQEFDYNYISEFDRDVHVDHHNHYGSEKSPVLSTMKDDYDLTMGDYPDSVLHVQLIERNTVNGMYNPAWVEDSTFDYMGTDSWLQRRSSRIASLNSSIAVRLTVPGNTTLQAGDMIGTELLDDSLSGKYLVKRLTHSFSRGGKTPKHITTLDCIRDTVKEAFPNSGISRKDEGSSSNTLIPRGSADVTPIQF